MWVFHPHPPGSRNLKDAKRPPRPSLSFSPSLQAKELWQEQVPSVLLQLLVLRIPHCWALPNAFPVGRRACLCPSRLLLAHVPMGRLCSTSNLWCRGSHHNSPRAPATSQHPSRDTARPQGPQLRGQKGFGRSISSQKVSERPAHD